MKPEEIDINNLHITKRNLPHWQRGDLWYFITFRTKDKFQLTDKGRDAVSESILHDHGKRYHLSVAVVMPDHVHMAIKPLLKDEKNYFPLSGIMYLIKGVSARKINVLTGKKGTVWQDESFDRIIRNEDEWREKYEYIRNNVIKADLAVIPEEYPWLIDMSAGSEG